MRARRGRARRGRLVGSTLALGGLAAVLAVPVLPAGAQPSEGSNERNFAHVSTFDVNDNGTEVAEIVSPDPFGLNLFYTDSETGRIGKVGIWDPQNPVPMGAVDVGGEPTSVAVTPLFALAAVNTSTSFTEPSGHLAVINVWNNQVVHTIDLGGQPDSIALSPNGRYAAVVIENERDEDLGDGLIPQEPAGSLVVIDMRWFFVPQWWSVRNVDLTGISEVAPSDPEPEYVDINKANKAVVSMQENNHLAVVDLRTAAVESHFSAGEVTLEGVDATEEAYGPQEAGDIQFTETITRRREPDTVQWVDNEMFITANEGDYEDANGDEGGSRGFTVFDTSGNVVHDSGTGFEYESARAGHYPEGRSANKGVEPEGLEVKRMKGTTYAFVGAERSNVVGVYGIEGDGSAEFRQLLPSGIGPEGLAAIDWRGLLAVSSETSVEGVPSMITLYSLERGAPSYPMVASADDPTTGAPVPWVALSGMAGDPVDPARVVAVSDSILGPSYIYDIDVSQEPAVVTSRTMVSGYSSWLDAEGIAPAAEGGWWIASEGRVGDRPNALVRVDAAGAVQEEIELPAELSANMTSSGFEGVAATGGGATEYLYSVVQRPWADDAPGVTKIARYDVAAGAWGFADYQLEAPVAEGSWVGLSEITALPDGSFAIVERDNALGRDAAIKRIYGVDLASVEFAPFGEERPMVAKTLLRDVLGDLADNSIWTPDKLEGVAVTADGALHISTDNDGLDDAVGQTVFLDLGNWMSALGR